MNRISRALLLFIAVPALLLVSCEESAEAPFSVVWEKVRSDRFVFSIDNPAGSGWTSFEWQDDDGSGWKDIVPEGNTIGLSHGMHTLRVRGVSASGEASSWKTVGPVLSNDPPEEPYFRFELLGNRSLMTLKSTDPDGDDITYDMEYSFGEGWTAMETPESYHDFELSPDGPCRVSVRARARDSWDSVSEWVIREGVVAALPETPPLLSLLDSYDDSGLVRMKWVSLDGNNNFSLHFYLPGGGYTIVDNRNAGTSFLMPTGSLGKTLGLQRPDEERVTTFEMNIWIPEVGETAFIRPVIFVMDDELYRDAVGVVVDTSLSFEEMSALKGSRALMKDLGVILKRNTVPYEPVWSYLDEENVLHIATTADTISFWHGAEPGQVQAGMSMFRDMESLRSADLTGFDLSSSESLEDMFRGCTSLESVTFPEDICSSLLKKGGMFEGTAVAEGNDVFVPYAPFASEERYVADSEVSWQEEYTAAGYDRGRWNRMTAVLEDRK